VILATCIQTKSRTGGNIGSSSSSNSGAFFGNGGGKAAASVGDDRPTTIREGYVEKKSEGGYVKYSPTPIFNIMFVESVV